MKKNDNIPIIAFSDVKFSNGADLQFVTWIEKLLLLPCTSQTCLTPGYFSYAGWNTDGNTQGTVISNAVLLSSLVRSNRFTADIIEQSKAFTILRILEDSEYQAVVRTALINYLANTDDQINHLERDLDFYQKFVYKLLIKKFNVLKSELRSENFSFNSAYFPWNRTFEIGFHTSFTTFAEEITTILLAKELNYNCDIIVAGGSTASLAAALVAADESPDLIVCLTEPTDWLGGQLTSSLISAIDFGKSNSNPKCMPNLWQSLLEVFNYPHQQSLCWVSKLCYEASTLLDKWINPQVEKRKNLKVFYNTCISSVEIKSEDKIISSITAIQRTPKVDVSKLSFASQFNDWYDPKPSNIFDKNIITLSRVGNYPIVIDATELGDLLELSDTPYSIGIESGYEGNIECNEQCGQGIVFPFYH